MPRTPRLLLRAVVLAAALPLAGACRSGVTLDSGEHWTSESVPERMFQHFAGYRRDLHGSYVDYQYQKKREINTTLRRHFVNGSPDNPFLAADGSQNARRTPHSLAPDPVYYIHAEGVLLGLGVLGLSGSFVPLPLDSLMATAVDTYDAIAYDEPWEFWAGFTGGASDAIQPPRPSEFEVKNR